MAKKAKVKNWREFFESDPKELPFADMNVQDEAGRTMLIGAARSSVDVVQRIIDAGADVNAQTDNGETALIVAASSNEDPAVVEALIKAGADIEIKSNDGGTALMFAVSNNKNPAL